MTKKEKQVLLLRILLGVLIVCNMAVIFLFSSQNGAKSAAVSKQVVISVVEMISKWKEKKTTATETPPEETVTPSHQESVVTEPEEITTIEETTTADPMEHLTKEQKAMVNKAHTPIRKLAHMLEFGSLAILSLLLLVTWPGKLLWRYAASLGFALVYAATDELHQLFSDGRGARLSDVFIDFSGAFIACTLALIIVMLVRRIKKSATADSSATEQKPTFVVFVSQMFSRFQFFVSGQISKLKEVHKKKEKEK